MKLILVIHLFLLMLLGSAKAEQYQKPMEFYQGWSGGSALEAMWIAAIGVIEEDTAEKFKKFIKKNNATGTKIVLHSPGGNLIAGIQLGLEIRKLGLDTFVGNSINNSDNWTPSGGNKHNDFGSGNCLSSCAYAFLGGVDRVVMIDKEELGGFYHGMSGSKIGFHQFYAGQNITKSMSANEATTLRNTSMSDTQFLTGIIAAYIVEMGVNAKLIQVASLGSPTAMIYPTLKQLEELNITNQQGFSSWAIEPYKDGLIASIKKKRNNDPYDLVEQVTVYCKAKSKQLTILLTSPKTERANNKASFFIDDRAARLFLDDREFIIHQNDIGIRQGAAKTYFNIKISNKLFKKMYSSNKFSIQLNVPRANGGFFADGRLEEQDKKSLKLTLSNCI